MSKDVLRHLAGLPYESLNEGAQLTGSQIDRYALIEAFCWYLVGDKTDKKQAIEVFKKLSKKEFVKLDSQESYDEDGDIPTFFEPLVREINKAIIKGIKK